MDRAEENSVGNKGEKDPFDPTKPGGSSIRDVSAVLHDALKRELEKAGHAVVAAPEPAAVSLRTVLKRYWSEPRPRFFDVEMTGLIDADVSVVASPGSSGSPTPIPISATFRDGVQFVTDNAYGTVLNKTLAEFMRILTRDAELIEAMRTAIVTAAEAPPEERASSQ